MCSLPWRPTRRSGIELRRYKKVFGFAPTGHLIGDVEDRDDLVLLGEYTARGSEAAFETLVNRYVGLVYSAALRQVRDPHGAEEVAQTVFTILAKKAGRLRPSTLLGGWLLKTTRFVALAQTRAAARRHYHEQECARRQASQSEPG